MKKYDFSDKKLKKANLRSAIWSTVLGVSPILCIVVIYRSNAVLVGSVIATTLAAFAVSYLWAFFYVFDCSDLRPIVSADGGKTRKKPSRAALLLLSLLVLALMAAILMLRHFDGLLVKCMLAAAALAAIPAFPWAFYFTIKDWNTDIDFDDA